MTEPYPFDIISDLKSGKIDKSTVIDKLFAFLLKTDDHKKKIVIIDFLFELYRNLRDWNIEPRYYKLFKYLIQIERFVYVIHHINDSTTLMSKKFRRMVVDEIVKRYVLYYDVVPEEVQFIIDLDRLSLKDLYSKKPRRFFPKPKNTGFITKHNHIIGMKLERGINRIPVSIGALKKLKSLHIYTKSGIVFPRSVELLTQLRDFKIYSNFPIEIPITLKKRAQDYFIQKYLQKGIHSDDAVLLAKLEIIGWDLDNLETNELFTEDPEWYHDADAEVWDYRLDRNGRVIEIYIKPKEGRCKMAFFPDELCYFEKLEVLQLWFFELEYIPEAITELTSLKLLTLSNFGKKETRISKKVRNFLESLPHLSLESKMITIS
jgi:hypothetical protein